MIFGCQYCGGLEPYIIACAVAAWAWGAYRLARVLHWVWYRPQPPCQPCGSFIFCAIDDVRKCPKIKPRFSLRRLLHHLHHLRRKP